MDECVLDDYQIGYEEAIELVDTMLQRSIAYWKKSDHDYAEYYIDAYRCAQENVKQILRSSNQKVKNNE